MMPGDTKEPPCVPDFRGGTNFNPPSYDPALQLFFVMARETCAIYTPVKQEMVTRPRVHERRHEEAARARLWRRACARHPDRRDQVGVQAADAVAGRV